MKLANGFGWAIAAAAMVAAPCAEGAFQVKQLYHVDDRTSDRANHFDVELAVYYEVTTAPDAQGSCLTYVIEGNGIDCSDNLDEGGNHRTLNGVYDIEQANHPMVVFDEGGWATVKAKLSEKDVLRVTGVFGPYDPMFVSSAPNGKDQRKTCSTDGLLTGMTFYVIERDPGIYEPTGYVYAGDDATADPNVSAYGMTKTEKLSASEPDPTVHMDENPRALPAGALLVQGEATGSSQTVFVVNMINYSKLSDAWGHLQEQLSAGGDITLTNDVVCDNQALGSLHVPGGVVVSLDLNGHTIDRALTNETANAMEDGGVFVVRSNGSLAISDSKGGGTITGGKTSGDGGGVLVESGGSFTMTGGTFAGNVAGGRGGAIHSEGALRVTGSAFVGNGAALGNAIHTDGTNVVINYNAFIGNGGASEEVIVCDDPPPSVPGSDASLEHPGFADNNWFGAFRSNFSSTPNDITDKWWFLRIEREIDDATGRYRLKAVPCLYSSTSWRALEVPDPADYRLPPITLNCFATSAAFDGATATNPATIRLSREGHASAAFEPQIAEGGYAYTVGVVVPGYESLSESLTFERTIAVNGGAPLSCEDVGDFAVAAFDGTNALPAAVLAGKAISVSLAGVAGAFSSTVSSNGTFALDLGNAVPNGTYGATFAIAGFKPAEAALEVRRTTTSVRIVKVWDDGSDRAGRRPSSVSFTLVGGSFVTNVVLDCSGGADRVETTVSGVPRYEGGSEIAYALVEDPVPGNYRAVVVDEGKVVPEIDAGPGVSLSLTVNDAQNVRIGEDEALCFAATLSGAEPVGTVNWSWNCGGDTITKQTDVDENGNSTLSYTYNEIKVLATAGEEYVMTATYRTNGVEAARARVPFGLLGDNPSVVFVEPALDDTFYVDEGIGFKVRGYLGRNSNSLTLKWQCAGTQLSDGYSAPADGTTEAELAFREAGDHRVKVTVADQDSKTGSATIVVHVVEPPEPIQSFSVTNSYAPPPVVSNVVARQRWPWNGLVDVDYEVGGDTDGLEARISFAASDGRSWVATNFLAGAEPSVEPGPHRATWDTAADGVTNVVAANVVATVCLEKSKYAELYLVTSAYTVSDDGTQILDRHEEPVDPANLPTRQTIEFGTEQIFKVIGAVPDAASPGSVLYSVVEDAEPVLATDADTIANAGFRVSVARTASAGDTATIQAVRHGVKSGAMTIAAVPYRSIFVCDGHMVLSDDGSKLYDPNWPDDLFTYADFLLGPNFSFGRFRGDDVPFQLVAVDTVQEKLVRIDVKDNPGDEDAKVLLSGANPECFTLNLAGSCVHINADATDGAKVCVRARYRGLESAPEGFIITAF